MKSIVWIATLITLFAQVVLSQTPSVIYNQNIAVGRDRIENTIYDSDTNHLWNRLNETLFDRSGPDGKHYGLDELDILYWNTTTNLLGSVSHQQATNVLDEFINTHSERLIQDPLKKALLQRDLWALFDWTAEGINRNHQAERKALLKRLAIAIQRLELTTNEIASLPDNYMPAEKNHLSDLPNGLFQTNGDWINVSVYNAERLVPMHDLGFGGRSVFMVLFHDADGRKAGMDYLKRISSIKPMWIPSTNPNFPNEVQLNVGFPQFPTNSQWALARRMCVIDTDGRIRPTHTVESIQLRTYRSISSYIIDPGLPEFHNTQHVNEFQMTRPQANLISIAQDERRFTSNNRFFSFGMDAFEDHSQWRTNDMNKYQSIVLQNCYQCHGAPGIYSVNSFTRFLSGERPAETTQMVESDEKHEEERTLYWKEVRSEFGLLQGLWLQQN
jgi:hypothetical protein